MRAIVEYWDRLANCLAFLSIVGICVVLNGLISFCRIGAHLPLRLLLTAFAGPHFAEMRSNRTVHPKVALRIAQRIAELASQE